MLQVLDLFIADDTADKIELRHLKRVAKELGENMTDDELNQMIIRLILIRMEKSLLKNSISML